MADRAKYDGPFPAVDVELPSGKLVTVERGHLLPNEHEGENVPATLRDDLLSREDWKAVADPSARKKEED